MSRTLPALFAVGLLAVGLHTAKGAAVIHLPYPAGVAVSIIQGYNGGTHQGVERYSLDLTRDDGNTSGSPALAPAPGTVVWAYAPGTATGCIGVQIDNGGGLYEMLCHVLLNRVYANGEHVTQGQQLGTVAPPGQVGNNGVSHIHLQLYKVIDGDRTPVPFAPPDGLPLEGISLPPSSGFNQWACNGSGTGCHMMSQNSPSAPTNAPTAAPTRNGSPAISASGSSASGAASLSGAAQQTLQIGQSVVVTGTGDCLRVHASPTISANVVYCLPDGSQSVITDGPQVADGYNWFKLSSLGWAVADYLNPVDGSSIATATAATPAPAASPTVAATPAASPPPPAPAAAPATPPAPTNAPLASPTPQLPVGYSFAQGSTVVVAGTGDCLRVHSDPALAASVSECLTDGTQATVSDGPVTADGYTWFRLDGHGWVDAEYLQAAS